MFDFAYEAVLIAISLIATVVYVWRETRTTRLKIELAREKTDSKNAELIQKQYETQAKEAAGLRAEIRRVEEIYAEHAVKAAEERGEYKAMLESMRAELMRAHNTIDEYRVQILKAEQRLDVAKTDILDLENQLKAAKAAIEENKMLRQEVSRLQQRVEALEVALEELRQRNNQLAEANQALREEREQLREQLQAVTDQLAQAEADKQKLQTTVDALQQRLDDIDKQTKKE